MTSPPEPRPLTHVCSWCKRITVMGGPIISHGICDECAVKVLREVAA